jgi:UDP-N-acetyl-D-glucosamine dehydrogenase
MKGSRIMALGVAYKRDVSDTRESAALRVIELLLERGADVSYHDPFIRELQLGDTRLFSVPLKQETLESTDLVVITADHTDVDYVAVAKHAPLVYDTRNAMRDFREVHIRRLGAPATLDRATTQANRPGEATTDPTGSAKG